jgi:predicted PurR-regulated permease PerM
MTLPDSPHLSASRNTEHGEAPRRAWRTSDFVRAAVIAIVVYAIARVLLYAYTLVFVAFLGVLFGIAVSAGTDVLQRLRIPRGFGAPAIVVTFLALLVGFGIWTGPTLKRQYRELQIRLPQAMVKLDHWVGEHQDGLVGSILPDAAVIDSTKPPQIAKQKSDSLGTPTGQKPDSLVNLRPIKASLGGLLSKTGEYLLPVITSTFALVSGIILVLFLAIYVAIEPGLYRRGVLAMIPPNSRARWDTVICACSQALRKWLITQLIAMVVIGIVTTSTLMLLGVEAAFPLGILAGLLEFVPTLGPIMSSVPAIAMAFVDSPEKALVVAVAYIGIQFIENNFLIPILMKEGVDLPPVLTILTQAFMALLFGFIGLFIAVPVLVLASVIVRMMYVEPINGGPTAGGAKDASSAPPGPPVPPSPDVSAVPAS